MVLLGWLGEAGTHVQLTEIVEEEVPTTRSDMAKGTEMKGYTSLIMGKQKLNLQQHKFKALDCITSVLSQLSIGTR